jgi:hypothetical protein
MVKALKTMKSKRPLKTKPARFTPSQSVFRFRAKTSNEVVPCTLRRGRVPPALLKELRALVEPSLQNWTNPNGVSCNDFGSRDAYSKSGAVLRDNGGDLCWMGNERIPKTKVSAGPYKRLAPEGVRAWLGQFLEKNRGILTKIAKFSSATHDSTQGPKPAFAVSGGKNCIRDSIFPYICVQRRWPMKDTDGTRLPWHVDGGPSICFMTITLEGTRVLEFETWVEKEGVGKAVVKKMELRPGDWYWTSPTSFWHRVTSAKQQGVSTSMHLRSAIMLRRISGGRVNAKGKKTAGMKYATKDCFVKLASKFADVISTSKVKW